MLHEHRLTAATETLDTTLITEYDGVLAENRVDPSRMRLTAATETLDTSLIDSTRTYIYA